MIDGQALAKGEVGAVDRTNRSLGRHRCIRDGADPQLAGDLGLQAFTGHREVAAEIHLEIDAEWHFAEARRAGRRPRLAPGDDHVVAQPGPACTVEIDLAFIDVHGARQAQVPVL
jgi:hypothetical protein